MIEKKNNALLRHSTHLNTYIQNINKNEKIIQILAMVTTTKNRSNGLLRTSI
jgi:hypothetical protein